MVTANHQQIRKQALLQAVHCCGKITNLAKAIGVSVARVSNWLNRNDRIPYEYAILIEEKTGISIDRLSPQTTSANQVMRQLRAVGGVGTIEMLIDKIIINEPHDAINQTINLSTDSELKRPIIIDQNWHVVAGVQRLLTAKALGQATIATIILDTRLSLLGLGLKGKHEVSISDRVAVAQKIENQLTYYQQNPNMIAHHEITAAYVAGFTNQKIYLYAKQAVQKGIPHLIQAMDNQQITIPTAASIAKLTPTQQFVYIHRNQKNAKNSYG